MRPRGGWWTSNCWPSGKTSARREIRRARDLHVTPYELLTVASMVEREAQVPGDRPKIAAVIYNRLREGMPLGIDATIYYAVELRDGIATYTHELTEAQLHIDSPYNTRTHTGLPPTPISNPGLASIRAAAYPAHVPYLYYVAGGRRLRRAGVLDDARRIRSQRRGLQGGGQQKRRTSAELQEEVMPRLGVLGWPVAHSRSPAMHNAAFAALGMSDWRYQRLPVPPELFAQTTRALGASGFLGRQRDDPAQAGGARAGRPGERGGAAIGAANTLTFAADGAIAAENTDAPGLIAALGRSPRGLRVLVLGAGGSARAAVWALREAGASEVSVWNRTPERAEALARDLGVRAVPDPEPADLLVNCTSVGLDEAGTGGSRAGRAGPQRLSVSASIATSSTWSTRPARRRCSTAAAGGACARSTASRSCSPRGRSASSCGRGRAAPLEAMRQALRGAGEA